MKNIKLFINNFLRDHLYQNTLWLIASTLVLSAGGFFFWMIAAQLFTTSELGLAVTLLTLIEFLATLCLLGWNIALIRFLPKEKSKEKMITTSMVVTTLAGVPIATLFVVFAPLISSKFLILHTTIGIAFIVSVIAQTLFVLIDPMLTALRKSKEVFVKNSIFSLGKVLFPLVTVPWGIIGLLGAWILAWICGIGRGFYAIKEEGKSMSIRKNAIDFSIVTRVWKFASMTYVAHLLGIMPIMLLPTLITLQLNSESAAYYYVAYMIAGLLYMIPIGISEPLISESVRTNKINENIKKAFLFCIPPLLIGILFIVIFGKWVLSLFGSEFVTGAWGLLIMMSIASIPTMVFVIFLAVAKVQKKLKTLVIVNALWTILLFSVSIVSIQYGGLFGVGVAWLIVESILAVITTALWIYQK